jgi:tetratricopeptide (TPR) repeat protein
MNEPAYHERLGDVLISTGDTASGLNEYRTALQLSPTAKSLDYKLGLLLEKKGDAKGAWKYYRSFLLHDSMSVEARRLQQRLSHTQP